MYNLGEIKTLINSKFMLLLIHILPMSLASCGFLSRNTVYFEVMQSSAIFRLLVILEEYHGESARHR